MKIGFDGKRALRNMTGLGNYSRLVVESLAASYHNLDLTLYSPRDCDSPRLEKIRKADNIHIRLPRKGESYLGRSVWRTYSLTNLLRAEGIQLFHGLSNELPLNIHKAGIPCVLTMHDVIYRRMPDCYNAIDRAIYDFKYGHSCRNATRIIAVSERTSQDVAELYHIPTDKIDVVYQGCDDSFRRHCTPQEIETAKRKYGVSGDYIIQVGSIEKRKNALLTVRALTLLPASLRLVLVGRRTPYLKDVMAEAGHLGIAGRIRLVEGASFADLPALYQGAQAAAYPSHYEGFGIPVLEALNSRIPCVAATGSCLEEAGGEGTLYVSPDNPRDMADALQAAISNTDLRRSMIAKGLRHASHFSNADIPARIMEVYRKAMEEYRTDR